MQFVDDDAAPPATSNTDASRSDIGLAAAISQAGHAVVITDPEGSILYVNAAFTAMTGYSSEEVIGQNPRLLKSGMQDPAYYRDLWRTITAGQNWQGDLLNRRKDGSLYIEDMIIAPVRNSNGMIARYIAFKQDVTERRASEEARRFLAAIVASSDDAVIATSRDGTISSWNEGAVAMYGYRAAEAIGRPISMLISPERHVEVSRILDSIRGGRKLSHLDTVGITKDGRSIDTSLTISVVRDGAGRITGAAAVAQDIGERRRAERSVRDSAARFQALFESSLDCLYIHDFEGNLLDLNPAALKLLGYERSEIRSLNLASLLSAEQLSQAFQKLKQLEQAGAQREPAEFKVKCKSGMFVDLDIAVAIIPSGNSRAILGVARDISNRKLAEEALRSSEEKFRQLTENIREVFWIQNAAGTEVLYVSPAYEQIWGRTCQDLYGDPTAWLKSVEPDDLEQASALIGRPREGEQIESEYRIRTPSGELKWVRDRAFPVRDQSGQIIRVVGVAEDVSGRKKVESELAHQAHHDYLTGLPNHLLISDRLQASIEQAGRTGSMTAVIYVDLDGFKFVNDTLGHEAGDALLQQVTVRLQGCIREPDTLARMGGDEFMMVINNVPHELAATAIAERLRMALRKSFTIADRELYVTASVGVAMFPRDGTDVSTLRRNADAALNEAKRAGKDRFLFFAPSMRRTFLERLEVENELRRAIERNQLSLVYQPIFKAQGGAQTAFEALLRWEHPVLGAISPSRFIPVAEESGLIVQLGTWVLEEACRQCRVWQAHSLAGVRVAVNVSALEFAMPDFTSNVLRALDRNGLPGHLLDLELTETTLMRDMDGSIQRMERLRELGVRISIDDFGTGYSSLGYLPRLPADLLKIDRSFVAGLGKNEKALSLIQGMISLAHNIGKRVVVEGVETPEQLHVVRSIGADDIQGFLLGRPAPPPNWNGFDPTVPFESPLLAFQT